MKIKLVNIEKHLKEELKDPRFKEAYELERVKVALAQKIAEIRDRLNLNQSELARRMHVSQQFISQVESGEGNLTLETLWKLGQSLNMGIQISFTKQPCRHAGIKIVSS
jgi:DNA-binding XRE family transcriptional regulator